MSYNSSARQVRDVNLPVLRRHSALRSCILHLVWLTHQSSYWEAVTQFETRVGLGDAEAPTEEKIMKAFAAVEEERTVALGKVDAFARKRRGEKVAGRSTPSRAELDAFFLSLDTSKRKISVCVIDGSAIQTWADFVASINTMIPLAQWQGNSLDALDDILYGGYGTPKKFAVAWINSDISRRALGLEATRVYYKNVPDFEHLYKVGQIKTLFEMVVDIFKGRENIELRLE